jgi:UDP-glucose:(glucosyl)LPS alpha-1,2-glucosyltransferase
MPNAINPLDVGQKPTDKIKLIYHSTPHRGLNILYAVFTKLCETHDDIELDVFSSFKLYGWPERDEQFQEMFDACREHPKINYHGAVENDVVRKAISEAHIFAYPSIWPETSCLCLMEAMSGETLCVHPNYAALYETAANWTMMYQWHEDINAHANMFYAVLDSALRTVRERTDALPVRLQNQKAYADLYYGWDLRTQQWEMMLKSLLSEPRELQEPTTDEVFSFDTNG